MSEDIRRICRGHNIRVAFRSSRTLRSMLSSVKDKVHAEKQSGVIYKIPCSCGKVSTGRRHQEETRDTAERTQGRLQEG